MVAGVLMGLKLTIGMSLLVLGSRILLAKQLVRQRACRRSRRRTLF